MEKFKVKLRGEREKKTRKIKTKRTKKEQRNISFSSIYAHTHNTLKLDTPTFTHCFKGGHTNAQYAHIIKLTFSTWI